ncbi:hypothetical protein ACHHYP_08599 [Achlya hypogyna]|uniref:Transmembrane protein n=1 Tax=Achlya hypogyna TaxID=1202772 RepID=A0A1V9ZKE4_ACHHY|nr:hypothetical protein ACHHYP_08599 [Achlya hypogyna]
MAKPAQRRRGRRAGVSVDRAKPTPISKPSKPVASDASAYGYLYAAIAAAAITGAHIDVVALAVPSRYVASWWRFLFVVIVCINVRNHVQFVRRSLLLRVAAYIACNFAGMTVIQTMRRETLGFLRSTTPWIDVATAAVIVEGIVHWDPPAQAANLMKLRGLCALPVAIWKCWSIRQLIEYAFTAGASWIHVFPMVTCDMYASGITLAVLAHVVSTRSLWPTHAHQLQWAVEIAATTATSMAVVTLWRDPAAPFAATQAGYTLMLAFNLHKFGAAPLAAWSLRSKRTV